MSVDDLSDRRARRSTVERLEPLCAEPQPRLTYHVAAGEWQLWWPCQACGGVVLPLRTQIDPSALVDGFAWALGPEADRACARCETRRRRRTTCTQPEQWYDTELCEWVVRVPHVVHATGLTVPLGIRASDAPRDDVDAMAATAIRTRRSPQPTRR